MDGCMHREFAFDALVPGNNEQFTLWSKGCLVASPIIFLNLLRKETGTTIARGLLLGIRTEFPIGPRAIVSRVSGARISSRSHHSTTRTCPFCIVLPDKFGRDEQQSESAVAGDNVPGQITLAANSSLAVRNEARSPPHMGAWLGRSIFPIGDFDFQLCLLRIGTGWDVVGIITRVIFLTTVLCSDERITGVGGRGIRNQHPLCLFMVIHIFIRQRCGGKRAAIHRIGINGHSHH
jgi:hypothetical protein